MAAPMIRPSQRKANLSTLSLKENTPKVTRKNILCPVSQEWPRVAKDVEDLILTKLTEKLASATNIVKHIKKTSADDKSEKARIRSQIEIGTSGVFRALEQDQLTCILISGQATPAITVDHIISLARDQGCPLLCLDQLAPEVAKATKSKFLPLAIGFKKIDNPHSEFAEVISLVKSHVMVDTPRKKVNLCATQLVAGRDGVEPRKANKYRPIQVSADARKEILGDLKKIFSQGLTGHTDKEKNAKKKKKQKKKKNLKDSFEKAYHFQFDIGKRTVTGILERGKYEVILVSEEIVPVLLSETQSFSLLSVAAVKKCPVVVLPGLVDVMRTLCGGSVSVLGLKKISSLQEGEKHFKQVIEACLQAVNNVSEQRLSQPGSQQPTGESCSPVKLETTKTPDESCLVEKISATSTDTERADVKTGQDIEKIEQRRLVAKDSTVISKHNAGSDEDEEVEDYSYLYVMKTESKELAAVKNELQALTAGTGNDTFSADYISLSVTSSEPRFQSSSSGKQKGHFSTKQKTKPVLANKSACLSSKKPKITVSNSDTVTKDTELCVQQKVNVIPFTEIRTSTSQNDDHDAETMEVDAAVSNTSAEEASLEAPLFSVCRSGNPISQSSTADATQQNRQYNEAKLTARSKEDETMRRKVLSEGQGETPFFSFCRSGDPVSSTQEGTNKAQQRRLQNESKLTADSKADKTTLGVQELRTSADNNYKGIDFLSLVEPSKDAKKAVKRKLQSDKSYISFAYTESNIQTMVSNPSKKKKKKKQKK